MKKYTLEGDHANLRSLSANEAAHKKLQAMFSKKPKVFENGEWVYHLRHMGAYYYLCPDRQLITKRDQNTYWFTIPANPDYISCGAAHDLFRTLEGAMEACKWRNKRYRKILKSICNTSR